MDPIEVFTHTSFEERNAIYVREVIDLGEKVLEKALRRCDVAIGAISAPNGRTPCIVNEDMVKKMKAGAVIVPINTRMKGLICIRWFSL